MTSMATSASDTKDNQGKGTSRASIWHRLTWPFRFLALHFVVGDNEWGLLRLLVLGVVIFIFAIGGRFWETVEMTGRMRWAAAIPLIGWIPQSLLEFIGAFFTRQTFRYWYPPLFGAVLAFAAGALYLRDIFELKSFFNEACYYLFCSLFGLDYPTLTIRDGQKKIEEGRTNLIDLIGGPGHVDIKLGNAVLFEKAAGPSSVYGAGEHFIHRFEAVREIVSLEEQHREIGEADAVTKDGIPVTVRNIEATFRVRADRREQRSPTNPYPFSRGAIRRIAYDRAVSEKGVGEWQGGVIGAVKGRITGWVAKQNLDAITAPLNEDPRKQLRDSFDSKEVRKQFRDTGVDLLWVSIGHIDSPQMVDAQRLSNWRAFWTTQNTVTEARARATEISYKALGRAEAQAETLQAITAALRQASVGAEPETSAPITDLLLVYMAQILEAMTASPGLTEGAFELSGVIESNAGANHSLVGS